MRIWAKWFRFREWFKTLFNHRAIIRELFDKVDYTEDNAFRIINLLWKEKIRMIIGEDPSCFGYTIMLVKKTTHAYLHSDDKLPPVHKIYNAITKIKEHDKKKAGKK